MPETQRPRPKPRGTDEEKGRGRCGTMEEHRRLIRLDPEYRWLVAAHPSLRYGRILSRDPALSDQTLKAIAPKLVEEGFDLCTFVVTPQTAGRDRPAKLCEIVR